VHAREELGVDPSELPSPVLAGASSLAAFSSGALIPLLRPGLRQLALGAVAVAVTFAVGNLIGGQVH
jgi:vacuolar iron transporter family protein